jgi:hypothetical protein
MQATPSAAATQKSILAGTTITPEAEATSPRKIQYAIEKVDAVGVKEDPSN